MKNNNFGGYGMYIVITLIIIIVMVASNNMASLIPNKTQELNYTELLETIKSEDEVKKIKSISVKRDSEVNDAGEVVINYNDGTKSNKINIVSMSRFMENAEESAEKYGLNVVNLEPSKTGIFMTFIPFVILAVVIIVIFMFFLQQMQGGGGSKVMNFGKSRAKLATGDKNKVTFNDVAGLSEEKADLEEIVEFLKVPKKFIDIGARIPKGVLLVGPPGTGKTLLAKAVAGEAGVPFFSISGSDFVEMFVGVGASRVRDLFEQAKKSTPCLIFIDEIDAVGRKRGAGLGGGHDEREQTLNQLLVEMDGFGVNEGVIVLAATNRPDILDPALLRPGRFDRQIVVNRPDVKGREEILNVHAKGKKLAEDVNLEEVAKTTSGFTGADLENLLNEAALLAAREDKKCLDAEDLKKAFVKVGIGTEKKSRVVTEKEKKITAYHEAGHAIIFEKLPDLDPVHIVSIIPTGMAGGYTMPLPSDKGYQSKSFMEQDIISLFGGRAAEELILKDITTGASNDIERASAIARSMVMRYGMSKALGPIQFGNDSEEVFLGKDIGHARNYGEEIASKIDKEISDILTHAYSEAKRILTENIDVLHETAKLLIEKEKISGDEFRAILNKNGSAEEEKSEEDV